MNETMPRTPFSTPLSGSARETEIRIRSIMSGPKKRPPVLFLALVFSVCVFCGNLVSCHVKEAEGPETEAWVDYFDADEMPWEDSAELQMEEYPGVTFRWTPYGITTTDEAGNASPILDGMPIWNVILCDLNGDGKRELCATVYFGSGITDSHIEVYDYAAKQWYILWDRGEYDYALSLEGGHLQVSQWEYQGGPPCQGEPIAVGGLALSSADGLEGKRFIAQVAELSQPDGPAQASNPGLSRTPDWNRNGIPESFVLLEEEDGDLTLEVWENGQRLCQIPEEWSYPGSQFLCTLDGVDYILNYSVDMWQRVYRLDYQLVTWNGEFTENARWNSLSFDLNFGSPNHRGFDPEAIAAFVDELNELLSHSELLVSTDSGLPQTGQEDLSRLERDGFTQDLAKSLLENLRDFKTAMLPDWEPPTAEEPMPLTDQPIEMTFSSGVGAWRTVITLHGDGAFTGDYEDADMDVHYVCRFHGRFGNIVPASATSFYMTLEELVLDTKRPVGQEWDEGGIHYISSEPYGFDGADGKALKPGAGFIFYLPNATGHEPGTDLYGAYDFWTWWPGRHLFQSASDTLGRFGLHNLTSGYGFFSD